MRLRLLLCAALVCFGVGTVPAAEPAQPAAPAAAPTQKFELKDGDRVVFLGNTLIEREQKYGYWELMLTMAWPERNVTFRNLGWSGDTVWGESRAGFGSQADGFKKLVEEVNAARPTVIFVGYGNVEAFDGETGLPKFVDGFGKLLDELEKTKARIVILGPTRRLNRFAPSRAPRDYNDSVMTYATAMRKLAEQRRLRFIDLASEVATFETAIGLEKFDPQLFSVDGVSFGPVLYSALGSSLMRQLQPSEGPPEIAVAVSAPTPAQVAAAARISALESKLYEQIQKKNELFFHRWRPQNETYLFGFRKHEQGKNAVEVFQFDPLVEAEEKKIAELRGKLAAEMKANGGAK